VFILNEYNKEIGNRIRELRELSDFTINEIASELNITEETCIQYENGEVDIPASFLYELAHIFKVDLGLLLTGEESRMSIFDVTRANKEYQLIEVRSTLTKTYVQNSFIKKLKHSLLLWIPKRIQHLHSIHTQDRNLTMFLKVH